MASSKRAAGVHRALSAAAAVLVVLAAVYTIGWFELADYVRGHLPESVDSSTGEADCINPAVKGYPFRLSVHCDVVSYTDRKSAIRTAAGPLSAAVDVFNPQRARFSVEGPARVEGVPGRTRLLIYWDRLHGQATYGWRELRSFALGVASLTTDALPAAKNAPPLLKLASGRLKAAIAGTDDLRMTAHVEGLVLPHGLTAGELPPLSGDCDVTMPGSADALSGGLQSLRNRSLTIDRLLVQPGGGASASVTGDLSVDGGGLVSGTLHVMLVNPKAMAAVLAKAFPQAAAQIGATISMLASLGARPVIPVKIAKGSVSVGLFTIAQIPPLG